jgi:hypothetical protein
MNGSELTAQNRMSEHTMTAGMRDTISHAYSSVVHSSEMVPYMNIWYLRGHARRARFGWPLPSMCAPGG